MDQSPDIGEDPIREQLCLLILEAAAAEQYPSQQASLKEEPAPLAEALVGNRSVRGAPTRRGEKGIPKGVLFV